MNIGLSLSPSLLCGRPESVPQQQLLSSSGGVQGWLRRVREAGCTHIELRTVRPDTAPETIRLSAQAVFSAGLHLSVHGTLADEPAEAFWGRLQSVLSVQPELAITVHSLSARKDTLLLLQRMGQYAAFHHPSARIALENNRSKPGDRLPLVGCTGILETVERLNLPNVGICWDFGHFCWNRMAHPSLVPADLPPEAFLRRVIHTHIHSVLDGSTHFPLTMGELPLNEYLLALSHAGYKGIYNLEPEPERWADSVLPDREILASSVLLAGFMHQIKFSS